MSIFHSEDVHLIDYLRVVYKRRVFCAVVVLAALGGAFWTTSMQVPIFRSSARILLDNEATLVDFPGVERRAQLRIDTEMVIMNSREVAERAVASRLKPGLDRKDPQFELLVRGLMANTGVDVVRNTYILEMRTLSDDPEKARSWCDSMAASYVDLNFEAKKDANAAAAAAIREQIDDTQRSLELAERRLMDFKTNNNLVSDQSKRAEQEQSVSAGTTAKVANALKQVEYENRYRSLLRWYQSNDFSLALPTDLVPSPIVNDLYTEIVKKRMTYHGLLGRYREQHPKAQAEKAQLDTLTRSFDQEVRNALTVLKKSAELYGNIGEEQAAELESRKTDFLRDNERDWQYNVLQRNVDVQEEIYRSLLKKLGEVNVSTAIVRNNVRVVDHPKLNPNPIRPNWRFNILVGLVFGLGAAIAGVFFLEYLDKTLKTPDDIARYLELPVLAVVPLARSELLRAPYERPQLREGEPGASPA